MPDKINYSLIQTIISFSTLISTLAIFCITIHVNRKLSAKEHEISENFKEELLKMVLALISLLHKINANDRSISRELLSLSELRLRSGYMLFMLSFKKENEGYSFDKDLQYIISKSTEYEEYKLIEGKEINSLIRRISHVLTTLADNIKMFMDNAKLQELTEIKEFIQTGITESENDLDN